MTRRWVLALAAAAVLIAGAGTGADASVAGICSRTAGTVTKACLRDAWGDYWIDIGNCLNLSTVEERQECRGEAKEDRKEAVEECGEIYEAYLEACALLGEEPYDPEIDPADFVSGVDNPYFPLVPGRIFVYEGMTDDGLERVETAVTHDTVEIMGVECMVVRDVEYLDGEMIEDTFDWYAQDLDGNVWYFGELSFEIEEGQIIGIEGSWKAGEDGAKPGIIMKAAPQVGDVYRQEFLLGEAEDMGEVIDLDGAVTVPYGTFTGTLVIKDFSPLDPGAFEHKHYASGLGFLVEIDGETGQRVELIDVIN